MLLPNRREGDCLACEPAAHHQNRIHDLKRAHDTNEVFPSLRADWPWINRAPLGMRVDRRLVLRSSLPTRIHRSNLLRARASRQRASRRRGTGREVRSQLFSERERSSAQYLRFRQKESRGYRNAGRVQRQRMKSRAHRRRMKGDRARHALPEHGRIVSTAVSGHAAEDNGNALNTDSRERQRNGEVLIGDIVARPRYPRSEPPIERPRIAKFEGSTRLLST